MWFYVTMIIESAHVSETDRNWIQDHWWKIGGIAIKLFIQKNGVYLKFVCKEENYKLRCP